MAEIFIKISQYEEFKYLFKKRRNGTEQKLETLLEYSFIILQKEQT